MNVRDLDPDFSVDSAEQNWERGLLGDGVIHMATHRRKDGTRFPVEISHAATEYEGVAYAGAFVRNISERVAAESQMQMLNFAFEQALDIIYIHSEDGRIIYANQGASRATGYSKSELNNLTVFDVAPRLDKDDWQQRFKERWEVSQRGQQQLLEGVHQRKDGTQFTVELSISHSEISGARYGFVFARDISERKEAEKQMKLLSFAVEHALDSIRIHDQTGAILYANEGACRATGYSREELTSLTVFDLAPDLSRDTWPERMRTSLALQQEGDRRFSESINRRKDGSLFPTEVSVSYANFEGNLYGFSFVRDITERKAAERQMHMLSFAVENALDAIRIFDAHGKIIYANQGACRITGLSKEEFAQLTVFDLAPELTPEIWPERLRNGYTMQKAGNNRYYESVQRKKGGVEFPVEISVNYEMFEGKLYGFSFVRDISERKNAEREMKMLSYAVENALDAIHIFDTSGTIVYVNDGACKALGYDRDELTSRNIFDLAPDLSRETWPERLQESLRLQAAGTTRVYETVHRKKDGTNLPIEISVSYAELEDTLYGFSFVRDITERKKTELQLRNYQEHLEELVASRTEELEAAQQELVRKERLAVLGQLTGIVSHELRNPLGTIRTAIYFVNQKVRNQPAVMRALERAERNVVRCDKIIDELLDYTRNRELELTTVAIDDWLMEVATEYHISQAIDLKTRFMAGCEVRLDPDRFRRCVINSLSNACEAMLENPPDKPKRLTISTSVIGDEIEIGITDSGPGIPEDELQKIFEPLYSTKGFGVGLGLPIVGQIMKQHYGSANISSVVGEGTTIALRFPVDLQAHTTGAK